MGLEGKLEKWVAAGLITKDQHAAITAHEQSHSAGRWKNGLGFSGLLCILLGISLLVAANWQAIPDTVKLVTHFIINVGLAGLVWRWRDDKTKDTKREVALFALWGLTLTLIALIGQVFQLGGEANEALRLWFWITTPMILLFAHHRFTARLWAIACVFYIPFDLMEAVFNATKNSDQRLAVVVFTGAILPLLFWLAGSHPRVAVNRAAIALSLRRLAILGALLAASLSGLQLYFPHEALNPVVPTLFAILLLALRYALHPRMADAHDRGMLDIIVLSGLFFIVPFYAPDSGEIFALLHFLAYWVLLGWVFQEQGNDRGVSFAINLITLRIFIAFVQVAGGLAFSGFGFILLGLVMIGLVRLSRTVNKMLQARRA